jgi:hypothetical protein
MEDSNIKYILRGDEGRFLLSVDKLILNMVVANKYLLLETLLNKRLLVEGVLFKEGGKVASKYYNKMIYVVLDGVMVGYFLLNDYQFEKNGITKFHFNKRVFYKAGYCWLTALERLNQVLLMSNPTVHTLEIAYDSPGKLKEFTDYYKNSKLLDIKNQYSPFGRKTISPISNSKEGIDGFYIGIKQSSSANVDSPAYHPKVQITIYNKTKVAKKQGELYFSDYFESNGFNGDVDRVELRVGNQALKRIEFDVSDLEDPVKLFGIFRHFAEDKLKWWDYKSIPEKKKGKKIYKTCNIITFSDYPQDAVKLKELPTNLPKYNSKSLKVTIGHLLDMYCQSKKTCFLDSIIGSMQYDAENQLQGWFEKKVKMYTDDVCRDEHSKTCHVARMLNADDIIRKVKRL